MGGVGGGVGGGCHFTCCIGPYSSKQSPEDSIIGDVQLSAVAFDEKLSGAHNHLKFTGVPVRCAFSSVQRRGVVLAQLQLSHRGSPQPGQCHQEGSGETVSERSDNSVHVTSQ